jgi:hypothetical protein
MEMLCPQCLSPLVSADGVTATCPAHGGSYQILFARAAFAAPAAASVDIPTAPQPFSEVVADNAGASIAAAEAEGAVAAPAAQPIAPAETPEVEPDWESVEIPAGDAASAGVEPAPQAAEPAAVERQAAPPLPPPSAEPLEEQTSASLSESAEPALSVPELPADELLAAFDEPELAAEDIEPNDSAIEAIESLAHAPPVEPHPPEAQAPIIDEPVEPAIEERIAESHAEKVMPEPQPVAEAPAAPQEPEIAPAPPPVPLPPPLPAPPPRPALLDTPLPPAPHRAKPGHQEHRKPIGTAHAPAHAHLPPAPPPPTDEAADAFHGLPPTARPLPESAFGPGIELPTPPPLSPAASRSKERVVPKPPPPAMAPPPPPSVSPRVSSPKKREPIKAPAGGPIHLPQPPDAHLPHQPPAPVAAPAARPVVRRTSQALSPVRRKMAIAGLALAVWSALGLALVATGVTAAVAAPDNLVVAVSVICLFAPWLGLAMGAFAYRIAAPNPKIVWATILGNCVLIFAWIFVFVLKHSAG